MILDTCGDKATSNKSLTDMSVKVNAKTFSILIDKLYQNKHAAIIRELSANAMDAHRSAGKSHIPFHITIPTHYSNDLIIRDFGDGLTADEIVKYLGTVMESSKDNDNDSIGAFGLGAKTPFALFDEYLVVSIKDGIKSTVMFVRENKGTPQFVVLNSVPTDEKNGTAIKISTEYDSKWELVIKQQLAMLKVKPILNIDIEWVNVVDYGIYKELPNRRFDSSCYIEMGEILYPLSREYSSVFRNTITVIPVAIGDVDLPPDRERVELTKKSLDKIEERYTAIRKQINLDNQATIDTMVAEWEKEDNLTYNGLRTLIESIENKYHTVKINYEYMVEVKNPKFISTETTTTFDLLKLKSNKIIYPFEVELDDETKTKAAMVDYKLYRYDNRKDASVRANSYGFLTVENLFQDASFVHLSKPKPPRLKDIVDTICANDSNNTKRSFSYTLVMLEDKLHDEFIEFHNSIKKYFNDKQFLTNKLVVKEKENKGAVIRGMRQLDMYGTLYAVQADSYPKDVSECVLICYKNSNTFNGFDDSKKSRSSVNARLLNRLTGNKVYAVTQATFDKTMKGIYKGFHSVDSYIDKLLKDMVTNDEQQNEFFKTLVNTIEIKFHSYRYADDARPPYNHKNLPQIMYNLNTVKFVEFIKANVDTLEEHYLLNNKLKYVDDCSMSVVLNDLMDNDISTSHMEVLADLQLTPHQFETIMERKATNFTKLLNDITKDI